MLLTGIVFGLSSGISPGPTLTLTISETIEHGFEAGAKVACAPLVTDAFIITISFLFLSSLGSLNGFYAVISLMGSLVLAWFARECLSVKPLSVERQPSVSKAFRKGVATNLLNPAPYLFWITVGTPTLMKAYEQGFGDLMAYLGGFFIFLVGSKASVALITARFRDFLRSRFYLTLMRLMGLALAFFAALFLRRAWLIWFPAA